LPYERVEIAHPSGLLEAEDGRTLRFHRTRQPATAHALAYELADAALFNPTSSMPYGRVGQLHMRGYPGELEHFVHCVRTGAAPIAGVDDAEQTFLIGQAVRRSEALDAQWVSVTQPA
jgi:predicted dehydrogenase